MENISLRSLAFLSFFSVDNSTSTPHRHTPKVFPNRSITRVIFLQRWHIKEKSLNLCASRYVVGGAGGGRADFEESTDFFSLLLAAFGPSLALHRKDFYVSDIFPSRSGCTYVRCGRHKNMLITWWYQHIVCPRKRRKFVCCLCSTGLGWEKGETSWPFNRLFCRIKAT